jgi:hypothetical protein
MTGTLENKSVTINTLRRYNMVYGGSNFFIRVVARQHEKQACSRRLSLPEQTGGVKKRYFRI